MSKTPSSPSGLAEVDPETVPPKPSMRQRQKRQRPAVPESHSNGEEDLPGTSQKPEPPSPDSTQAQSNVEVTQTSTTVKRVFTKTFHETTEKVVRCTEESVHCTENNDTSMNPCSVSKELSKDEGFNELNLSEFEMRLREQRQRDLSQFKAAKPSRQEIQLKLLSEQRKTSPDGDKIVIQEQTEHPFNVVLKTTSKISLGPISGRIDLDKQSTNPFNVTLRTTQKYRRAPPNLATDDKSTSPFNVVLRSNSKSQLHTAEDSGTSLEVGGGKTTPVSRETRPNIDTNNSPGKTRPNEVYPGRSVFVATKQQPLSWRNDNNATEDDGHTLIATSTPLDQVVTWQSPRAGKSTSKVQFLESGEDSPTKADTHRIPRHVLQSKAATSLPLADRSRRYPFSKLFTDTDDKEAHVRNLSLPDKSVSVRRKLLFSNSRCGENDDSVISGISQTSDNAAQSEMLEDSDTEGASASSIVIVPVPGESETTPQVSSNMSKVHFSRSNSQYDIHIKEKRGKELKYPLSEAPILLKAIWGFSRIQIVK